MEQKKFLRQKETSDGALAAINAWIAKIRLRADGNVQWKTTAIVPGQLCLCKGI
jgi:hypothetical protein